VLAQGNADGDPPDDSPPEEFKSYDENLATEHTCPKCGYEWSGGK
jgi:hypothetical protein